MFNEPSAPYPGDTRDDAIQSGSISQVLQKMVLFYQTHLSGLKMGSTCRFEPTCSAYALATLRHRHPVVALARITARILSCGPWHPGGFDPPPGWHPDTTTQLTDHDTVTYRQI